MATRPTRPIGPGSVATERDQRAGLLFGQIGERDGEVAALNGLGEAALGDDRTEDAIAHHLRALEVAGIGARDQQARAHAGLARALADTADTEGAERHGTRAVALYREFGMPDGGTLLLDLSSRA